MMSILRWIDDACLGVEATLLYSVRTADETLFGRELERLSRCPARRRRQNRLQ